MRSTRLREGDKSVFYYDICQLFKYFNYDILNKNSMNNSSTIKQYGKRSKMISREEQKEQRKADILAVGLDLFIKKGYAATKVSDIAATANMSTGLLFHYFESKEKLYESLIEIGVSGPQAMRGLCKEDPITFFREAAEMIINSLTCHPLSAKLFVLMTQAYYSEPQTDRIKELMKQTLSVYECIPLIVKGQEAGQLKEGDPKALSLTFWSAIQGVAQAYARDMSLPLPKAEWFVDILKC